MKKVKYSDGREGQVKDFYKYLNLPYEKMTEDKMEKLLCASKAYDICACGNQCASIPRSNTGEPKDKRLADLGSQFYLEVGIMNSMFCNTDRQAHYETARLNAINVHKKIEERAAEILEEMKNADA